MKVLDQYNGSGFVAYMGDSAEVLRGLPDNSVDLSVYSPPFASLFCYSASDRDCGNVRDYEEFCEQYRYISKEVFRVIKPGRLVAIHCMLLPASKQNDGFIGLRDFRGELIRVHQADGFIFHSEICIYKSPVTQMQRTKALGLLFKQLRKDSAMSRQGLADYLVVMRKPGTNIEPITKDAETFPVSLWQRYADPVWFDIDQSDTLQRESAREEKDERHLCVLQKEVIRRAVKLWSNPNDVILSPFMGIGSEGFVSLQEGRRFVGCELKASYFKQAVANLRSVEMGTKQQVGLFDSAEAAI